MSDLKGKFIFPSGQQLEICHGDLTEEHVDAIVNAANQHLLHGGGVAGVISRKGGPTVQFESDRWVQEHGPVDHLHPAWTSAGDLPARTIIHAVGPIWGSGDEEKKLADSISGSLALADQLKLQSIAFPAISTGIFGFPIGLAAQIFMQAIEQYYQQHPDSNVSLVRLVLHDTLTLKQFLQAFHDHFPA